MSRASELADVASQIDSIAAMPMGRGVALVTEDDGTPTGGFSVRDGTNTRVADTMHVMAVGRWY